MRMDERENSLYLCINKWHDTWERKREIRERLNPVENSKKRAGKELFFFPVVAYELLTGPLGINAAGKKN